MSKRTDALWRVWALLWQAFLGYLAAGAVGIVAIAWMVIDVLWQLIAGSEGLDPNSRIASQFSKSVEWSAGQTIYAITGGGDGEWRWSWTA